MWSVLGVSTNLLYLVTLWLLVSSLRHFICKQLNSNSLTATCSLKEVLRFWRYIKTTMMSKGFFRGQKRMANSKRQGNGIDTFYRETQDTKQTTGSLNNINFNSINELSNIWSYIRKTLTSEKSIILYNLFLTITVFFWQFMYQKRILTRYSFQKWFPYQLNCTVIFLFYSWKSGWLIIFFPTILIIR